MKIYNAFGIKPTNTFKSAGSDYYIPNITNDQQASLALDAFRKSYKVTEKELNDLVVLFRIIMNANKFNIINLIHLYLALGDPVLDELKDKSLNESVQYFCDEFVIFNPDRQVYGIKLQLYNTLFINSGIRVALPTANTGDIGIAGLYVNKSGMGNRGFDIRACLVDEDYSGYVHLSVAYTKDIYKPGKNIVYCGDKLTQMMLIPVFHTEYEEIPYDEYEELMNGSERGDAGFGSSDVK